MRVYVDIVTLVPTAELWERGPIISNCTAKHGDGGALEIMYHRSGVPERLPEGYVITYIVKSKGKYDQSPALVETEIVLRPATDAEFYTAEPDYDTEQLAAALRSGDGDDSNDLEFVIGDGEISFLAPTPGAKPKSSLTFPVTIYNDVKKGNEGPPSSGAPGYLTETQSDARYVHQDEDGFVPIDQLPLADQAQAEAGLDNAHLSTPLRVWQAIAAWWAALSVPWAKLTGKPTTLGGYGITDATASSRTVSAGTGLTGGGDLTVNRTLSLTGQALALFNLATNGLIARTSSGVEARTITAATASLTVTNGDGVSGNPTIGLAAASTATRGGVVLATNTEVQAGTDSAKGIVSSALAAWWNAKNSMATIFGASQGVFNESVTYAALAGNTWHRIATGGVQLGAGTFVIFDEASGARTAYVIDYTALDYGEVSVNVRSAAGFTFITDVRISKESPGSCYFDVKTAAGYTPQLSVSHTGVGSLRLLTNPISGATVSAPATQSVSTLCQTIRGLKINGTSDFSGNITGSGTSNTLPNQTASSSSGIVTFSLGDARYQTYFYVQRSLGATVGDYVQFASSSYDGTGVYQVSAKMISSRAAKVWTFATAAGSTGSTWVKVTPDHSKTAYGEDFELLVKESSANLVEFRFRRVSGSTTTIETSIVPLSPISPITISSTGSGNDVTSYSTYAD